MLVTEMLYTTFSWDSPFAF
uniref:Uncharacterized protein n=1 Tax=Rhizophora mucronata TaxID=61149 RepID=A0A2P2R521_RHIMU